MRSESDASALAVADAMGPDFTDLAPPGEAHFDPASMLLLVGYWVVGAVVAGVQDGIRQASKDGTAAVLHAIDRSIRRHIVPEHVQALFSKDGADDREEARRSASAQLDGARQSSAALTPEVVADVARVAGAAASDALSVSGLDKAAASRVGATIEVHLTIVMKPSPT